ncbi:MAG TPA: phosphatase domain-containing protein [Gemmatimonadaceae bacterium]|nr:phosphatase domain-containing protein [Gemmatimonadaceae bacterium]
MSDSRGWAADVGSLIGGLGKDVLGVAARVAHAALGKDPYEILAYRGYGNGTRNYVYGRVIEKRDIGTSSPTDTLIRNLYNTYRRADSDPLHFANVKVEYAGGTTEMKADDEGFFGGWLETTGETKDDNEWQKYSVELLRTASAATETAPPVVKGDGEILVPPPSARFCIISDIDDTVIQSRVSNFLQAARTVMLGNARTRLPFPGVAAFYEALRKGATGDEKNPIFYVSSSPWNIYDVISEFMDIQRIPKGPLMLRDWDIGWSSLSSARHSEHKGAIIKNILEVYPHLDVILIGDSGQHDPEIYRQAVADFPNRIKAIYIRDVTRNAERSASVQKLADEVHAAQSVLVLAEDTLGAAKHAADQGWISPDTLPDVKEEKHADEGKTDAKVATPQGGETTSGAPPTVIE